MSVNIKLEDFFPIYIKEYDIDNSNNIEKNKNFYNSIPIKKEFDVLRPVLGEKKPKQGEYLIHQQFMSRFF
jgi:hypothetical protein